MIDSETKWTTNSISYLSSVSYVHVTPLGFWHSVPSPVACRTVADNGWFTWLPIMLEICLHSNAWWMIHWMCPAPVMDNPPFAILPQGYCPVVGTSSSTEKKIRGLVLAVFFLHVGQSHDRRPRNACSCAKSPRWKKKIQEQLHNDLGQRSHGGGHIKGGLMLFSATSCRPSGMPIIPPATLPDIPNHQIECGFLSRLATGTPSLLVHKILATRGPSQILVAC